MSAAVIAARPMEPPPGRILLAGYVVLVLLLSAGVQTVSLAGPLLIMHVFDGVLEARSLDTLWVLAVGFVVVVVLGGVLRHQRAKLLAVLAERMGLRLQLQALTASVRAALHGDRTAGVTALQDVAEVRRLLGGTIMSDLLDVLFVPLAVAFLYALHPLLAAVALTICLLQAALGVLADRTTRGMVARASKVSASNLSDLTGRLRQRDLIFGLGMLPAITRRWAPKHVAALEGDDAAQRRAKSLQSLAQVVTNGGQVATVAMGAWLVTRQQIPPGGMFAAFMVMNLVGGPLAVVVARWREWAYGRVAWRRLSALARDAAPPVVVPPEPMAPEGLQIEGLELRPPGAVKSLLSGLSLSIPPGEAWAVLGPNGSGKTTLLRAVLGLSPPAAGRVLLDGQDSAHADRASLGPRLGYLPQDPQLLNGSVIDNIGRFAGGAPAEAIAAARSVGAHEAIGRLSHGYENPAGAGAGLSGGQRRLVALARALHGNPRLVVLDEPETGLDAATQASLRAAVVASRAAGAVVLLVTHQPEPWREVLDGTIDLGGDGTWSVSRTVKEGVAA